jgi:hypothetical protein
VPCKMKDRSSSSRFLYARCGVGCSCVRAFGVKMVFGMCYLHVASTAPLFPDESSASVPMWPSECVTHHSQFLGRQIIRVTLLCTLGSLPLTSDIPPAPTSVEQTKTSALVCWYVAVKDNRDISRRLPLIRVGANCSPFSIICHSCNAAQHPCVTLSPSILVQPSINHLFHNSSSCAKHSKASTHARLSPSTWGGNRNTQGK